MIEYYFEVFIAKLKKDKNLAKELLKFFVNKNEMERMVTILYHQNLFFSTIRKLAFEEILDPSEVFLRGNTTITKSLRYFQEHNGKAVYQSHLEKHLHKLSKTSLHLDEIRSGGEKAAQYSSKLAKLFEKLFDVISSIPIPLGIAVVCSQIADVLKKENPSILSSFDCDASEQLSVGSILFLYTICPLFTSPSVQSEPGYRNLIFFAKVLQSLANGSTFEQYNMIAFNYLLENNRQKYHRFALDVVNLGVHSLSVFQISVATPFKEWKKFFKLVQENKNELSEYLRGETLKALNAAIADTLQKRKSKHQVDDDSSDSTNESLPRSTSDHEFRSANDSISRTRAFSDTPQFNPSPPKEKKSKNTRKDSENQSAGGLYRF